MRQSDLFYHTQREKFADSETISYQLLARGGFIDKLMAGVYTLLPLGLRVIRRIEDIIRRNMQEIGAQEILMPALHPKENWQITGRWQDFDVLFKLKGAEGKEYALAPTHEEVISPLVKKKVFSYRDLPLALFQIQTKFRNELRVKSGILRTREFIMKDLYSFHTDEEDLNRYYERVANAYLKIFKECGIYKKDGKIITFRTLASGGSFSKYSDEFQTITPAGEDIIYICKKCSTAINKEIIEENKNCPHCGNSDYLEEKAIEIANIFKLGTRFSQPFDLSFKDKMGREKFVLMGCYGIGISRLFGAIVEIWHDEKGIIWPLSIAPFQIHLIPLEKNQKVFKTAERLYKILLNKGFDVLFSDKRGQSIGENLVEADLIGIPYRLIISEKTLRSNCGEVKERGRKKIKMIKIKDIANFLLRK